MRAAIIENGQVVNVAVSSAEYAQSKGWIVSDDAQIGDTYNAETGEFTRHYVETEHDPVPQVVSSYQALQALKNAGLYATAKAWVDEQGEDSDACLAWNRATEFQRNSPLLNSVAQELGLADEQLDDLFRQAATIVA